MNSVTVTITVTFSGEELDHNIDLLNDPEIKRTHGDYIDLAVELAEAVCENIPQHLPGGVETAVAFQRASL